MTANNNLVTNFNVDPYYDDYDETKNFHRVLYRPGFAVQARELTQQQTILQNQIHRFGNHIFKDGSQVSGSSEVLDQVGVLRLKSTYGGVAINVSSFEGKYARSRNSQDLFYVKKAVPAAGGDNDLIYVQYLQSANTTSNSSIYYSIVSNNDVIDFSSSYINSNTGVFFSNTGAAQVLSTAESTVAKRPVTRGFLYSVDESVYYHKGLFIRAPKQTVAVAANIEHIVSIGFTSTETLVTSDNDSTLTDPARGSYNYTAPGADRLKVELTVTAKPLSSLDAPPLTSNNYFEVARVKNGQFIRKRPAPDYNTLADVLAKRTYEESGNYAVEGLKLSIANTSATTANLVARFSPGTAYVKGYRIRTGSNIDVAVPKSRALDTVTEQKITTLYGNYLVANTLSNGLMNIGARVELHTRLVPDADSKIGEAHVRNLEFLSGTSDQRKYKLFLYDTRITSSEKNFNSIKSIRVASSNAYAAVHSDSITSFNKTGGTTAGKTSVRLTSAGGVQVGQVVSGPGILANTTVSSILFDTVTLSRNATVTNANNVLSFTSVNLSDKQFNRSLFLFPHTHVANTSNIDYKFKRKFSDVNFSSGSATIQTLGGSERFSSGAGSLATENFIVVVKTGGAGTISTGENVDMEVAGRSVTTPTATPGNPASATINVNEASFSGTADIYATIDVTADTRRVKTRTNTTKTYALGYPTSANSLSLGYADVIKINAIYQGNSTFVNSNTGQVIPANSSATTTIQNVTNNFNFNRNARDAFYDHSTITLKPGLAASTNRILVDFDYYAHGGGLGFFSQASYPDYNNIPYYRDERGRTVALRDALDFRPTRTADASANYYHSTKTFDNHQIVDSQTFEAEADYSYYKKIVHKLSLDSGGNLILTSGTPSLNNPIIPEVDKDQMLLATIFVNPYTYTEKDLRIKLEDNSRYTMKDIGNIEKRVEKLEYYTSLNLLESQVASTQFLDNNGDARYKNGFIVDPFKGHSVGNVFDKNYKASIDRRRQVMRPTFTSDSTELVPQAGSGLTNNNKIFTLPYSEINFVSQELASDTLNVNPFQVVSFTGNVFLDPSSDSWTDNKNVSVLVNSDGNLDHLTYLQDFIKGSNGYEYGDWQQTSQSDPNIVKVEGSYAGTNDPTAVDGPGVWASQITTTGQFSATKLSVQVETDTSTSTRITESVFYPYMRTRKVNFTIQGARPNTKLHLFLGGIDCTQWMAPNTFSSTRAEQVYYSDITNREIITDSFGSASGYFWVPNTRQILSASAYSANPNATVLPDLSNSKGDSLRFEAGTIEVLFVDNFINPQFATSYASTTFSSRGKLDTYTTTTTMTKRYELLRTPKGFIETSKVETGYFLTTNDTKASAIADIETTIGRSLTAGELSIADFITAQYEQRIGRRPEVGGWSYWLTEYVNGKFDSPVALGAAIVTASIVNRGLSVVHGDGSNPNIVCEYGYDPLAQTFTIPEEFYPDGIFISSADIFIAQKDSVLPLRVELRPTVNGFPSADEAIPMTQVSLNPSQINANATTPTATNVAFKCPIHLPPGEYCIVLLTDSLNYLTYVATIGEARLDGTGFVTEQPTLGSLFKSQNARTWTAQQESDLCFRLKQAQFTINTNYSVTLSANNIGRAAYNANTSYANTVGKFDIANISMSKFDALRSFNSVYELSTKNDGGAVQPFEKVIPNQDLIFSTSKEITTNNDLQLKVTFRTSDTNVSPYFDVGSAGISLIKNVINAPPTGGEVAETEATDSHALAKYITRKVTLAEGLEATSLKVFVDQNMPSGASVEVYYRVINSDDDSNFEERPYVLMTRRQPTITVNQSVSLFNEYEYYADDISYTSGSVTYDNFTTFSIKIVMYSTSSAAVPTFRNFRAIALA
jgi:hypothetical protein